jgi:hypothetical protein
MSKFEGAMSNPFFHGNPVAPDQFVDRRREVRRLVNRIANQGQSSALVGETRTGKTSLLEYLAAADTRTQLYGPEGDQLLFSFLDAQTLGGQFSQAQFWEFALRPLYERVVAPDPGTPLAQAYAVCRENDFGAFVLERLLAQIALAGWRLVLMLDEFDVLLHHPILNSAEFFGSLRSLASRSRGALALIIASTRSLEKLNRETQELSRVGSPFFNFLDEILLGPWPDVAVDEVLHWARGRFTTGDRAFLKEVAGGHPYLVQVAASSLWDAYEDEGEDPLQRRQQAGLDFYDRVARLLDQRLWQSWSAKQRVAFASVALAHINHLASQRGPADPDQYNIPAMRNLVLDAFAPSDLRLFCQDRPLFASLLNIFGPGWGLQEMAFALIEHCQRQLLFPELLSEIRAYNPRQYERYSSQLASLSLVGQIDFRPELRSLHRLGHVTKDDSIPGGWRVRPQVFLWWLADEVVCAASSRSAFDRWLQAQGMDQLMAPDRRAKAYEASRTIGEIFETGAAAFVEATTMHSD